MAVSCDEDWDWENSLRKDEIDQAINEWKKEVKKKMLVTLPEPWMTLGVTEEMVLKRLSIINSFKPKAIKLYWQPASRVLSYGDAIDNETAVTFGVKTTKSSTTNIEAEFGFKNDLLFNASLKESHSTSISNEVSRTESEKVTEKWSHSDDGHKDDRKVYYQLVVKIVYEDDAENDFFTTRFESAYTNKNLDIVDNKPTQSAENAWKSMIGK